MLRLAVYAYAVLYLVIAVVLLAVVHLGLGLALYLAINGGITVAALLFERRRYRPAISAPDGMWEPTGERFVDPSSGKVMEVHYNPTTGQRNYVEVERDSAVSD